MHSRDLVPQCSLSIGKLQVRKKHTSNVLEHEQEGAGKCSSKSPGGNNQRAGHCPHSLQVGAGRINTLEPEQSRNAGCHVEAENFENNNDNDYFS